jgi:hypothetical protein
LESKMALFSQCLLSLGAPDCPVVHRTVSGAPGWLRRICCSREVINGVRLKFIGLSGVHQTVRCAPDCPVCTGLSGEPTVGRANGWPRDPRETRGRANGRKGSTGLSGVYRIVSDAPTAPDRQRSASPDKEGDPHRTVSGGAPDCPARQATEGKICLSWNALNGS